MADPRFGLGSLGYGGLHGQHRQSSAQIYGNPFGNSGLAQQGGAWDPALAQQLAVAQQALKLAVAQKSLKLAGVGSETIPVSEPVENTGIEVGEVTAWRAWRYNSATGMLESMVAGAVWPPDEPMDGAPCKSGIGLEGVNAFKTARQALEEFGSHASPGFAVVIGRVSLWGEVVEYEKGYRAEFGKPATLDYLLPASAKRKILNDLQARYGCPVDNVGRSPVQKVAAFSGPAQTRNIWQFISRAAVLAGVFVFGFAGVSAYQYSQIITEEKWMAHQATIVEQTSTQMQIWLTECISKAGRDPVACRAAWDSGTGEMPD